MMKHVCMTGYVLGMNFKIDAVPYPPDVYAQDIQDWRYRNEWQCKGVGVDHTDIADRVAAHSAQRTLHLPKRRQIARPGCARGRAGIGVTKFSGVPAYNSKWSNIFKAKSAQAFTATLPKSSATPFAGCGKRVKSLRRFVRPCKSAMTSLNAAKGLRTRRSSLKPLQLKLLPIPVIARK